ncbi:YwqJ-related putative deaminase [Myceligenerans cantabricum]
MVGFRPPLTAGSWWLPVLPQAWIRSCLQGVTVRHIYGESGSVRVFHPEMQEAPDSLPKGIRKMRISGWCAEIACINDALHAGRSPSGAVIDTRAIGTTPPGHGLPKAPCPTCGRILPYFCVGVAE